MAEMEPLAERAGEYYRAKLAAHGGGARGMDWRDQESQYLRFEVLSRYLSWDQRPSVLDVGCGDGEFLAYCQGRERSLDYRGLDVCPEMVAACNARFGAGTARVGSCAGLEPGAYDYVLASGTFNVRQEAPPEVWWPYVQTSLIEMYRAARVALVVNFMTTHVDYRYDHLFYADANSLGELAVSQLSRRFLIDHSYPLYELTFAVWRA